MTHNFGILVLAVSLVCGAANAQDAPEARIEKLITHLSPESEGVVWASGDLKGDGTKYIAIYIPENDGPQSEERLLILKRNSDDTHQLIARSLPDLSLDGTPATRFVQIKKDSLFIGVGGPSDYEYVGRNEFQFKYRNDGFYLIGFRLLRSKNSEADDQEISVNYLTGDKIEWKKVGNKRQEIKTKKTVVPPVKFEQFKWTVLSFPLFSVFQGAAIMLPSSAHAEH